MNTPNRETQATAEPHSAHWRPCLGAAFLVATFGGISSTYGQMDEWTRQLGSSEYDTSNGVSADGLGNVYVSGCTNGSLGGDSAGLSDAFISKYDASGSLLWTRQLGTSTSDVSRGVSADGLGNIYISGWTYGSLEGDNAGDLDAFLVKISDYP